MKSSPEEASSFLSRISFQWITGLMIKGYQTPLTEDDILEVHHKEKSRSVVPRFQATWKAEWTKDHHERLYNVRYQESVNDDIPVKLIQTAARKPGRKLLLLKVILKTFGWEIFLSQIWALLNSVIFVLTPLILGELISFTEDSTAEVWKGYLYALGLFLSTFVQAFLFHQINHQSTALGLRMRAALISAVFKKALTMNKQANKDTTVGETVNLMSVDAEYVLKCMINFFIFWTSVFEIALCLYLLYTTVGVSMFAGLSVLAAVGIANAVFMAFIGKYQTQIMLEKDRRIKLMNEVLNGMKVLKLYAWEKAFRENIRKIREKELKILLKINMLTSVQTFSWTVAPYLISLVTFVTYLLVEESHHLSARTAFVAISFFNLIRIAVNSAPIVMSYCVKATVSIGRIGRFLTCDDLDTSSISHDSSRDHAIEIINGTFTWDPDMSPLLKSINLQIPHGSLVAVVGQVGTGKSSLVSAMLGDMTKVEGFVNLVGKVAYVPQEAWIQNNTIQNNVLFGKNMDQKRYDHVIEACALRPDFDILPGSDMTEIGEKGINLSGGQKQRISLARAVYNDADIYLLDDPLSAVDSHVGKHIFTEVIGRNGILKDKTRILVTHGVHFLPEADLIVVMNDGHISEMASYNELMDHNGPFATFLTTYFAQHLNNKEEDEEIQVLRQDVLQRLVSVRSESSVSTEEDFMFQQMRNSIYKESEGTGCSKEENKEMKMLQEIQSPIVEKDKLIEEESVEQGKVKWDVYATYAKALGLSYSIIMLLVYVLYYVGSLGANLWLSKWTDDTNLNNQSLLSNSSERIDINNFYITVYGVLGIGQAICVIVFGILICFRATYAARIVHSRMLEKILRAPMSFFDTTPIGRIVNRFSHDVSILDNELRLTCEICVDSVIFVLGTLVVISYTTPYFIAAIIPVMVVYIFIQRFYIPTSRQLRRLESKNASPIYSHLSETISGASVIRAYAAQERFILESQRRVDLNQQMAYAGYTASRWMGIRLEILGAAIVFLASALAVITKESVTGGIVGLSITYALEITGTLNYFVVTMSDLETQIVSVERVKEYTEIPEEAALNCDDTKPSPQWPEMGRVEFDRYSMRYRSGLNLVLEEITCSFEPGRKVGIVGRTGAGKSSLAVALFRLIEPAAGDIEIDGIKISQLGLHDLRSKLTILPQDPVLFSGSLRSNLDPFNQYDDQQIWTALEHAHLKSFVESQPDTIYFECGEGGDNLSIGQRQLVCLARTLLRKTKILILDEATAAVDMKTDDLIQQTIRSEFRDCTVITIAHRLNTVMDYDKILVLDQGNVSAYNTPAALLQQTDGIFYRMAKDAGLTQ